jgi:hypothetical protein
MATIKIHAGPACGTGLAGLLPEEHFALDASERLAAAEELFASLAVFTGEALWRVRDGDMR